jgi:ATP-dependent RNA helicase DeaD
MEEFKKLGISKAILDVIEAERFEKPTEIQIRTIPIILEGKDVLGGSATGSGKTLAFGAGIIHNTNKGKGIQALILTPTRELAEQVSQSLRKFSKNLNLTVTPIYGGVSINPQMDALPRSEIVVGTPGRLLDHISRNTINLTKVKTLVLDEADVMLDMGFIEDVEKIVKQCPNEKQTLLFSATLPPEITRLSSRYMKNPVKINAVQYVDPKKLKQIYYDTPDNLKFSLLVHFLKEEHSGLVMIFCNTRSTVDFVTKNLRSNKVDAVAIHGGLTQAKRTNIMKQFNSASVHALVCTDVAARGLDIKGVSHIYNYDIPKESKQYVHRIGRTARAGKEGMAINLLSNKDYDNFDRVLRDNDLDIEKGERPQVEKVKVIRMDSNRSQGGRRGGFNPRRFGPRRSGPRRRH